jgi:hypothetical protein
MPRCAHASLPPKLGFGAFCLSEKCLADIFPLPRCRLIVLSMSRRFSTPRRRRRHSGTPEDAELADILDDLKNPGATTLIKITWTVTESTSLGSRAAPLACRREAGAAPAAQVRLLVSVAPITLPKFEGPTYFDMSCT